MSFRFNSVEYPSRSEPRWACLRSIRLSLRCTVGKAPTVYFTDVVKQKA